MTEQSVRAPHENRASADPVRLDAIKIPDRDRDILRALASEKAAISALPVHAEKAELWRNLNDLSSKRPMLWMNEIPWQEINVNDELTLQAEHPFARQQEIELRMELYQWRHMPLDMIVDNFMPCPLVIHNSGLGINEDVDIVRTDENSGVVSRHFNIQIQDDDDLEKIKLPKLSFDAEATYVRFHTMQDLYTGILPVRKIGQKNIWYSPWDFLIRLYGIENAMFDMIDRPDFVHAAVDRIVDACMVELDQLDALNLLSLDANNTRIGSGGYGYCSELPGDDLNPEHVHPHNMWGCSNAQIFSEVSPQFQWEFAVQHDLRWMKRWGLTYYGCCEQLHKKIDILRNIPNLRKISCSPWCKVDELVEKIGTDYVMSRKPNPEVFARETWHPELIRQEMIELLEATEGHGHVEFIFKDISTVRYRPQRLWEAAQLASEIVEDYAS